MTASMTGFAAHSLPLTMPASHRLRSVNQRFLELIPWPTSFARWSRNCAT